MLNAHRRRFLAGVGVAATAGALAAGSRAQAQGLDGEGFDLLATTGRLDGESGRR